MDATLTAAGTAFAAGQELFGEEEPDIQAQASGQDIHLPPDTAEPSSTPVSRMVIQRQPGGGSSSPALPPGSTPLPPTLTGPEFEDFVSGASKRGEFGERLRMHFVIPGQYTGSGWGIDRIGIRVAGDSLRCALRDGVCSTGVGAYTGVGDAECGHADGRQLDGQRDEWLPRKPE